MVSKLSFDDEEHRQGTLTQLNALRKTGGQFCDVTLEVKGHNIPGHKGVLACSSKLLFELFSTDKGNAGPSHFKLDQIDYDSLEALVNYAYTSRLEVCGDKVRSVYKAARQLKMHRAAEACTRHLADNLTPVNCLGVRAFANKHSESAFTMAVDAFIQRHLSAVLERSPETPKLPTINVDIMGVEDSDLASIEEKHLCKQVVDWLEQTLENNVTLDDLTESPSVLYLTCHNSLKDCLDLAEADDEEIKLSHIVQDYKKTHKKHGKRSSKQNSRIHLLAVVWLLSPW